MIEYINIIFYDFESPLVLRNVADSDNRDIQQELTLKHLSFHWYHMFLDFMMNRDFWSDGMSELAILWHCSKGKRKGNVNPYWLIDVSINIPSGYKKLLALLPIYLALHIVKLWESKLRISEDGVMLRGINILFLRNSCSTTIFILDLKLSFHSLGLFISKALCYPTKLLNLDSTKFWKSKEHRCLTNFIQLLWIS